MKKVDLLSAKVGKKIGSSALNQYNLYNLYN